MVYWGSFMSFIGNISAYNESSGSALLSNAPSSFYPEEPYDGKIRCYSVGLWGFSSPPFSTTPFPFRIPIPLWWIPIIMPNHNIISQMSRSMMFLQLIFLHYRMIAPNHCFPILIAVQLFIPSWIRSYGFLLDPSILDPFLYGRSICSFLLDECLLCLSNSKWTIVLFVLVHVSQRHEGV